MKTTRFDIIAFRVAIPVETPTRIMVCPWGEVKSVHRVFTLNADGATAIVDAFKAHGTDLPIDYEHATLGGEYATPDGSAPAMGWIKALSIEPGVGLWADVEWTKRGADYVASKEYRYLSPVVLVKRDTKVAFALHSVALTNKPAIVGMQPVVNSDMVFADEIWERLAYFMGLPITSTKESIMTELDKLREQLAQELGLMATADGPAILKALKERVAQAKKPATLNPVIAKALGVKEDADDAMVIAAINSMRTSSTDAGKVDLLTNKLNETNAELARLKAQLVDGEATLRINKAIDEGRITQADLDHAERGPYLRSAARDAGGWANLTGVLPVKAPPIGRVVNSGAAPAGGSNRTAVINKAATEWAADPDIQRLCNKDGYVADALRAANLTPKLTDDEKKLVA